MVLFLEFKQFTEQCSMNSSSKTFFTLLGNFTEQCTKKLQISIGCTKPLLSLLFWCAGSNPINNIPIFFTISFQKRNRSVTSTCLLFCEHNHSDNYHPPNSWGRSKRPDLAQLRIWSYEIPKPIQNQQVPIQRVQCRNIEAVFPTLHLRVDDKTLANFLFSCKLSLLTSPRKILRPKVHQFDPLSSPWIFLSVYSVGRDTWKAFTRGWTLVSKKNLLRYPPQQMIFLSRLNGCWEMEILKTFHAENHILPYVDPACDLSSTNST